MKFRILIPALLVCCLTIGIRNAYSQWLPANGIGGHSYTSILLLGNSIFAGCETGVFVSTDDAATWADVSPKVSKPNVVSLASIGNTIVAATRDSGVFLSDNAGASWQKISPANWQGGGKFVNSVVFHGSALIAVTGFSIFLSRDLGITWTDISAGLPDATEPHYVASGGISVYAALASYGVFRSDDNGVTWIACSNGFPTSGLRCIGVSGATVISGTYSGVYVSNDSGSHWHRSVTQPSDSLISSATVIGSNWYAGTGKGVFVSTDNGENWVAKNAGMEKTAVQCVGGSATDLFAGGNGIFASVDSGSTWRCVSTSLSSVGVSALGADESHLFAGTSSGVCISSDGGSLWKYGPSRFFQSSNPVFGLVHHDSVLLAATSQGIIASTDGGWSWRDASSGLTSMVVLAIGSVGPAVVAATNDDLFFSTNNGASWSVAFAGAPTPRVSSFTTFGTRIAAATDRGVIVSTDFGATWTHSNSGITTSNQFSLALFGNKLYAGSDVGIFTSSDSGATWKLASDAPIGEPVMGITSYGMTLFLVTGYRSYHMGNVFASYDRGASWRNVTDNIAGNGSFYGLMPFGTNLYVNTEKGLFKRSLAELGVNDGSSSSPSEISVSAFPNPTQTATTIRFTTVADGAATVRILSVLGSEIATLYKGRLTAGEHSFTWAPEMLPAGQYYCVVQADGNVRTIPITLLR